MRRHECEYRGCEHRRWRRDMVKIKYFEVSFTDGWWVVRWMCRDHFPLAVLE